MKVVVGASSFAGADPAPLKVLQEHGIEVVPNPYKRRMDAEEISKLLKDADGLLAGLEPLGAAVLARAPKLRALARIGIGMDNVDVEYAKNRGIRVSNTPDGPTQAVAELALGALLSLLRNLSESNDSLHRCEWKKQIGTGLDSLKVFFIGYGRIGSRLGNMLHALGADILAYDPNLDPTDFGNARPVAFDTGLAIADVVTLHAGGDSVILDANAFDRMQDGAILLNSARAGLIDESAFLSALTSGKIAKAWLDVFWAEPYKGPLTDYPQVLMTPHVSTYTRQCRLGMEMQAVENLLRDLSLAD